MPTKPFFLPTEVIEAHIRILKREMRNYLTYTDYLSLERWVDDNRSWMLDEANFQAVQTYAEQLAGREAVIAQKEQVIANWEFRVRSLCDHLNDVKRLIERGNTEGAIELVEMLPCFARTGSFYKEESPCTSS